MESSAADLRVSQLTTWGVAGRRDLFRMGYACFAWVEVRDVWSSTWVVMLQEVPRLRLQMDHRALEPTWNCWA